MSIYDQLKALQNEFEKHRKAETGGSSFTYFVEHCGKVKAAANQILGEVSEPDEDVPTGNNLKTVLLIKDAGRKTMADQKYFIKASDLPASKAWTASGILETIGRIKILERMAAEKTESIAKIEAGITTTMTVGNYKSIRKLAADGLREKMTNPKASIESIIPAKYHFFIDRNDIQTINMILSFIAARITDEHIEEIENMNYVSFKYSVLMMVTALRLAYELPPNYEMYRFCATLPKNPAEGSEMIQKQSEMIAFTDSRMLNILRLAKTYGKYEQYEAKVLGGKD